MTSRRRLAVLAASSLLLAGCAVPGQAGAPGTAVQAGDEALTSADLDALVEAWQTDSDGAITPDRQALATVSVLGPELIDIAAEQGANITPGLAENWATAWLQSAGVAEPDPSDAVVESVENVIAMWVTTTSDPTGTFLEQAFGQLPEDIAYSPRLGTLDLDTTVAAAQAAYGTAESNGLGDYAFTAFLTVNGFADTDAAWAARG